MLTRHPEHLRAPIPDERSGGEGPAPVPVGAGAAGRPVGAVRVPADEPRRRPARRGRGYRPEPGQRLGDVVQPGRRRVLGVGPRHRRQRALPGRRRRQPRSPARSPWPSPAGRRPGRCSTRPPSSVISAGGGGRRRPSFIFASDAGTITGWNPDVPAADSRAATPAVSAGPGPSYTGLALGNNGTGNFLYAADFQNGKIDVLDGNFHPATLAGTFTDPEHPGRGTPRSTSRTSAASCTSPTPGRTPTAACRTAGNGFVSVFDTNGNFLRRLVVRRPPERAVGAGAGAGRFRRVQRRPARRQPRRRADQRLRPDDRRAPREAARGGPRAADRDRRAVGAGVRQRGRRPATRTPSTSRPARTTRARPVRVAAVRRDGGRVGRLIDPGAVPRHHRPRVGRGAGGADRHTIRGVGRATGRGRGATGPSGHGRGRAAVPGRHQRTHGAGYGRSADRPAARGHSAVGLMAPAREGRTLLVAPDDPSAARIRREEQHRLDDR